jgi:heme oxygenase
MNEPLSRRFDEVIALDPNQGMPHVGNVPRATVASSMFGFLNCSVDGAVGSSAILRRHHRRRIRGFSSRFMQRTGGNTARPWCEYLR